MGLHTAKKGLDLPITGTPNQSIEDAPSSTLVAIVAADFHGMKPRMMAQVGDPVKRGQTLFEDRKNPGVFFTSPGAGTLKAINRGAKRALQSVVIELNANERSGNLSEDDHATFASYADVQGKEPGSLSRDAVKALLVESGLWTALRARPYGRVASPEAQPSAIFITATDTDPLSADVDTVMAGDEANFERGLQLVSHLTEGTTYLCKGAGSSVQAGAASGSVQVEEFGGKHPAGTVGYHIHTLHPVKRGMLVWHVGYQAVIAIGKLFATGKLPVERVISLAGPAVQSPRLLKTRAGASLDELVKGQLNEGESRVISGSVLSGRSASGELHGYLGNFTNQVSVLNEGREREFLGWLAPGTNKFSTIPTFVSKLFGGKAFDLTTTTNGSHRAMVPIGMYERVMPLDIMPTFLLRAIEVGDVERAEQLGVLELEEEDLALCTFVCPCKNNWGSLLRKTLTQMEKEG